MDILIYLTAALLILSKGLDCYTTWLRIGGNIQNEQNTLAARAMFSIGINRTIIGVFLLVVVVVVFSTWSVFKFYPEWWYKLLFVITGLLITAVQLAVAHCNYYRRPNFITRFIQKIYNRFL